eukprot:CAMPEP_0206506566 /NCGR_PEP_ID=MMETSP0324_2-20121206/56842_1 /ASSEMBLY_ACC=CAM_ASM_000836 /TAXON_ID=2866 /ORGANISM="Crypthecodinium cohnii, Strain Seligo" /LENGTH=91 /DNA_ID=CAMNT_0053996321 /DNA_START=17 /DNA_END=289 /DNA_ORIENTATION=-
MKVKIKRRQRIRGDPKPMGRRPRAGADYVRRSNPQSCVGRLGLIIDPGSFRTCFSVWKKAALLPLVLELQTKLWAGRQGQPHPWPLTRVAR